MPNRCPSPPLPLFTSTPKKNHKTSVLYYALCIYNLYPLQTQNVLCILQFILKSPPRSHPRKRIMCGFDAKFSMHSTSMFRFTEGLLAKDQNVISSKSFSHLCLISWWWRLWTQSGRSWSISHVFLFHTSTSIGDSFTELLHTAVERNPFLIRMTVKYRVCPVNGKWYSALRIWYIWHDFSFRENILHQTLWWWISWRLLHFPLLRTNVICAS